MGRPTLVFCGEAVMWAEFRPYEAPEVVRVVGPRGARPWPRLEHLLGVIDRITRSALAQPFG